jgi:hypothetical protein
MPWGWVCQPARQEKQGAQGDANANHQGDHPDGEVTHDQQASQGEQNQRSQNAPLSRADQWWRSL